MSNSTPTLASSYHEGYINGIKVALEFIEMADTTKRAAEALRNMVETLNKQETTR